MKRQKTSFSVEIKKSRTQGQRPHLPPRPLFEVVPSPAESPQILQNEAVPKAAEPITAPRILPSIVQPLWRQSEPAEPARRKRSSGPTTRGQMEFDLNTASEDVNDVPAETPEYAVIAWPTATAGEAVANSMHDVQPASETSAKSHARRVRKKATAVGEPAPAPELAPEAEPTPRTGLIEPATAVPSMPSERRLTKRLAAAGQLPRHERWKRRLHPASWRDHQRSKPI